jgi:NAD(P)H-flavin reductase
VGEFPTSLPPSPTEHETFFTVRQVGSCTTALHQLKAGDKFAVRGPYGNGFPMEEYYGKNLVFVAGGIGLIPLRSCIVYALKNRDKFQRVQIFLGAKTPKELMYVGNLREWERTPNVECHLTVDRADKDWTGNVGVVGSLFKKPGVQVPVENTVAFVCGPPIMFRFVIKDLLAMGFQEQQHCVHARTLHEMRRRQMRPLLHWGGLCVRGRPGVHVRANQETRGGHLMGDLRQQLRRKPARPRLFPGAGKCELR